MPKSRGRKQQKNRQPAKARAIVSIPQVRARAALDALTGSLVEWLNREFEDERSIAMALVDEIGGFIDRHAQVSGQSSVTEFTAEPVSITLEILEQERAAAPSMFYLPAVLDTYLHFLVDEDLWSGSDAEFDRVHALVSEEDSSTSDIIELPEVEDEQALAYFETMPLLRYARNLLGWVGKSREVTATGALRLKDVPDAAAQVDVGVRTKTSPAPDVPGSETGEPGEPIPLVRSMRDVERLDMIWESLVQTELLEVSTTRATPTAEAMVFLAEQQTPEARELIQEFIGVFLITCGEYIHDSYGMLGRHIRGKLMQTLDLALYPDRPKVPGEDMDEGNLLEYFVHLWMERFAALGIAHLDTHYSVPVELTKSIDMFTLFVSHEEVVASGRVEQILDEVNESGKAGLFDGPDTAPRLAHEDDQPQLPPLSSSLRNKSLQLRIDLEYAQPPIWRRLVVPADLSLGDLHFALQTAFGWDNSHLHNFEQRRAGGRQVLRFSDNRLDEGAEADEFGTSVGQLASKPKASFFYNYDFGDSWRLKLVVEKVVDTDPVRKVLCIGGRMRAPVDDIGGIPGWYHAIEVMADPRHADHEHIRDMLELEEGEGFDPKEFNFAAVDAQLARMFTSATSNDAKKGPPESSA